MEERLPEIKHAVIGVNRELLQTVSKRKYAAEKILIFFADKTTDVVDLSSFSNEEKEEIINNYHTLIMESIKNQKYYETLFTDSKDFQKLEEKALAEKDEKKALNIIAPFALGLGGALLANSIYSIGKDLAKDDEINKNNNTNNVIEQDNNSNTNIMADIPDIKDKNFNFYAENAIDNSQKDLMVNIAEWLASTNGKESWQKVSLTGEKMAEYGYENSECLFGFTAENMKSLALRFGNYSKDQYVTIMGGNNIDVTSVMNDDDSMSNGALYNIISYYVCSDECNLNIQKVINFNDSEVANILEIEGLLAEYKTLDKDGKEKEAFEKMVEIKTWLYEYAHNVEIGNENAKSYILRTVLPACSIISEEHQYKDEITLNLYDTKEDKNITKEVKTDLFDEIMMRTLVLGFDESEVMDAFNAEAFLEEHDISNTRYNLLNTDVERSIADISCAIQIDKLTEADNYISTLRLENTTAEAAYSATISVNTEAGKVGEQVARQYDAMNSDINNVNTRFDELTYGTYDASLLNEMVNNYLKENDCYPMNMNYFRTHKIEEMQIQYKDTHGVTQGKKGDTVKVKEQEKVTITNEDIKDPNAVFLDGSGNPTTSDDALDDARDQNEEETGIIDASDEEEEEEAKKKAEEEAKARADMLQGVYNATFNHFAGEIGVDAASGFNTSNTYGQSYSDSWANSEDQGIRASYLAGKAAGEQWKANKAKINASNSSNNQAATTSETVTDPVDTSISSDTTSTTDADVVDEIKEDPVTTTETVTESVEDTITDTISTEQVTDPTVDGEFSSTPPEGFSPVVDASLDLSDEEVQMMYAALLGEDTAVIDEVSVKRI